jgi:microcompartment protein CcmK/EutM
MICQSRRHGRRHRKDERLVSNKLLVVAPDRSGRQAEGTTSSPSTRWTPASANRADRQRQLRAHGVGHEGLPVDAAIVGVIDHIDVEELRAMQLAPVIGDVVATVKDAALTRHKLLVLQPDRPDRTARGRTLVALDAVGAGVGEHVFFVRGRKRRFRSARRAARRRVRRRASSITGTRT